MLSFPIVAVCPVVEQNRVKRVVEELKMCCRSVSMHRLMDPALRSDLFSRYLAMLI